MYMRTNTLLLSIKLYLNKSHNFTCVFLIKIVDIFYLFLDLKMYYLIVLFLNAYINN
jgi:hypothetical protein